MFRKARNSRPKSGEATPDDFSCGRIEGGEQRERAVTGIIMAAPFGLARTHRQQGLATIERLDLALLVDAWHHRSLRRSQVEPDDVGRLLDEQRVR